jgi:hypothetical protein
MYFFPVRVSFHIYFNTYFFSSVASAFYYRSFQPRFYDFIKFRFSKLAFGFYGYQSFFNFSNLIFPGFFFNPTRFTRQFYWLTLTNSDAFTDATVTTASYNPNFFIPYLDMTFSGIERGFFSAIFKTFFPYKRLVTRVDYFTNNTYFTNFYSYNSMASDFGSFYKFRSLFSTRLVNAVYFNQVSKFGDFQFFDTFNPFLNNFPNFFLNFSRSNFFTRPHSPVSFYYSFSKFYSPMRFSRFEPDFSRIPKSFRFFRDLNHVDRRKWMFERNRLPKYYSPFFSCFSTFTKSVNRIDNRYYKGLGPIQINLIKYSIENSNDQVHAQTFKSRKLLIRSPKFIKLCNLEFVFSVLKFFKHT